MNDKTPRKFPQEFRDRFPVYIVAIYKPARKDQHFYTKNCDTAFIIIVNNIGFIVRLRALRFRPVAYSIEVIGDTKSRNNLKQSWLTT